MGVQASSGVYVSEIDLSQAIQQAASSVGGIVITANRGPINSLQYITSPQQFLQMFGTPNPAIGYGHYAALAFLQEANQLYVVRAIGTGYTYAGGMLQSGTANTSDVFNYPQPDPTAVDFTQAVNGLTNNLAYFYNNGPGSGEQTGIQISSQNMAPVGGLTATPIASGGTLSAGSITYAVSSTNGTGETVPVTVTATVAANDSVDLSWNAVTAATAYNVYKEVGAVLYLLATVTTPTFTDTGALVVGTQVAPTSYAGTPEFNVLVYDLSKNNVVPVETWKCSLQNYTDGLGNQTELSQVINSPPGIGSSYIGVNNYAVNLAAGSLPLVYSTPMVTLTGGSSGSAVTDGAVVTALQQFADPEQLQFNILIGGGWVSPAVQLAMDTIASTRMDVISVIDVPSNQQTSAAAVAYRSNTLNLNSNYSALYSPDLYVLDPYNTLQIYVPPSGYAAAVMARTDRVAQPWYAPAGLNRGLLNILGLRVVYNRGDRNLLQPAQINYIRKFPKLGYAIMEAYTMQAKLSALSFIPVRRMLMVIETAVRNALLFSLWEPNDPILQQQISTMIGSYLDTIVAARGIKSYQVLCNSVDNPANLTAQGTLVVQVYIIPELPVARISLEMVIMGQEMSFSEAISAVNAA